jgi:hypothetical protein
MSDYHAVCSPQSRRPIIARKQDTFAKRQRENARKAKAEAKRSKRVERKDAPPGLPTRPMTAEEIFRESEQQSG